MPKHGRPEEEEEEEPPEYAETKSKRSKTASPESEVEMTDADDDIAELTDMIGHLDIVQREMGVTAETSAALIESLKNSISRIVASKATIAEASPAVLGSRLAILSGRMSFEQFKMEFLAPLATLAYEIRDDAWFGRILSLTRYANVATVRIHGDSAMPELKQSVATTLRVLLGMDLTSATIEFTDATGGEDVTHTMRQVLTTLIGRLVNTNARKFQFSDINFSRLFDAPSLEGSGAMLSSSLHTVPQKCDLSFQNCGVFREMLAHFKSISTLNIVDSIYGDGPEFTAADFGSLIRYVHPIPVGIRALNISMTETIRPYRAACEILYQVCTDLPLLVGGMLRTLVLCDGGHSATDALDRRNYIAAVNAAITASGTTSTLKLGYLWFLDRPDARFDIDDGEIARLALRIFSPRELRFPLPTTPDAQADWNVSSTLEALMIKRIRAPKLKQHGIWCQRLLLQLAMPTATNNIARLHIPLLQTQDEWRWLARSLTFLRRLHLYAACAPPVSDKSFILPPLLERLRISVCPDLTSVIASAKNVTNCDFGTCDANTIQPKKRLTEMPKRTLNVSFDVGRPDLDIMMAIHANSPGIKADVNTVTRHGEQSMPRADYAVDPLESLRRLQWFCPKLKRLKVHFGRNVSLATPVPRTQSEIDQIVEEEDDRERAEELDVCGVSGPVAVWILGTCREGCHLTLSDFSPLGPLDITLSPRDFLYGLGADRSKMIACRAGDITIRASEGRRAAGLFLNVSRGVLRLLTIAITDADYEDDTEIGIVVGMFMLLFDVELGVPPLDFKLIHASRAVPKTFLNGALELVHLKEEGEPTDVEFRTAVSNRMQLYFLKR